jgi:hypothetical protein
VGLNFWIFFAEVKRRNVYKIAIAYAVVGWRIFQIATAYPFFTDHAKVAKNAEELIASEMQA